MHLFSPQKSVYNIQSSSSSDEEVGFLSSSVEKSTSRRETHWVHSRIPWMISTALFFSTTLFLASTDVSSHQLSFEKGFKTDFAGVRDAVETTVVTFTGSPSFTSDGEEYVVPKPGAKIYVGKPSKEIDDNWNELTKDRYFLLNEDEARESWGEGYAEFWDEDRGGYLAGLDMFHTLHCLDHLRQAFYPEHYPQTPIHGQMHRDHCIDHLRQMIMCYADSTPIPTRWYSGINQNYIDSDRQHTCRDFSKIRAWTSERFVASGQISEHHNHNHSGGQDQ